MWNVPLSAVTAVDTAAGGVVLRGHGDAGHHGARRVGDRAASEEVAPPCANAAAPAVAVRTTDSTSVTSLCFIALSVVVELLSRLDVAVPGRAGKVYGAQPANYGLSESPGGTDDAVRACIPGRILRRAVRLVNWITQLETLVPAVRHRSQKRQSSGVVVRGFSLVWHDDPKGSYRSSVPPNPQDVQKIGVVVGPGSDRRFRLGRSPARPAPYHAQRPLGPGEEHPMRLRPALGLSLWPARSGRDS